MNNYLDTYGLREDPFRITPDPEYYYPSQEHILALNLLNYTMEQREGFCLLTGKPGMGKTTLLKIFMERWKERAEMALIMTPRLSPEEFIQALLDDFNIKYAKMGKNSMLKAFREFLLGHSAKGKRVAIIVDEAQNLPVETLEELRLLSNLETDKEKLLQIILVGQPELLDKIESSQLKQLSQRITIRSHLKPFKEAETCDYLNARLIKAGSGVSIVDAGARSAIHRGSGGIPRMINVIASRAIMAAYLKGSPVVQELHVRIGKGNGGHLDTRIRRINAWIREYLPYCALFAAVLVVTIIAVKYMRH
jgi:type II secretory pathway predicted ATPase ExeA